MACGIEVGVDPKLMGIGPAFAIPPALQQAQVVSTAGCSVRNLCLCGRSVKFFVPKQVCFLGVPGFLLL